MNRKKNEFHLEQIGEVSIGRFFFAFQLVFSSDSFRLFLGGCLSWRGASLFLRAFYYECDAMERDGLWRKNRLNVLPRTEICSGRVKSKGECQDPNSTNIKSIEFYGP